MSGGNIAIMRRANSGAPSIDWAFDVAANAAGCRSTVGGLAPACAHLVLLHEIGHVLGLAHSCGPGNCGGCGSGFIVGQNGRIMRANDCEVAAFRFAQQGPTAEDIAAARTANGVALQRLTFAIKHSVSYDHGSTWSVQTDTGLTSESSASAVGVAASKCVPAYGCGNYDKFALAWHGTDAGDSLNVIRGYTNGWFTSTKQTVPSSAGIWRYPSVASDTFGTYMVAWAAKDSTNHANANERDIRYMLINKDGLTTAARSVPPSGGQGAHQSALPPAVAFVKPDCGNSGYWVVVQAPYKAGGAIDSELLVRIAPAPTTITSGTWLAWNNLNIDNTHKYIELASAPVLALGSLGLSCSHRCTTHSNNPDSGRCVLTYETTGGRSDEPSRQGGYLRTLSFYVTGAGQISGSSSLSTVFNATPWGFSSGHRTTGGTASAHDNLSTSRTWHMGWSQQADPCWRYNATTAGWTGWPAAGNPCFANSGQLEPMVAASMAFTDYWNALLYYYPD